MGKKKFLTYGQQIEFLTREKNLSIEDVDRAKEILFKTGYFPLINGYKEPFKNPTTNQFEDSTRLEDIYELYEFDMDLRSIYIKYILIVERNIKSALSYHFCDIFGDEQQEYLSAANYDYAGKKVPVIQTMLRIIAGQLRKDSDYAYIRHYMAQYGNVPLWVLFNVLTIGQMSKIYSCQKGQVKIRVCRDFGDIRTNELEKMLMVMTKFRNVCAHNDRLFDYRTKDAILDMDIHRRLLIPKQQGRYANGKNDLYAQTIILKMLLTENDFKHFHREMNSCFKRHPIHAAILDRMGFPENWKRIARIKKYIKNK